MGNKTENIQYVLKTKQISLLPKHTTCIFTFGNTHILKG